jgi:Mg2+ and Co2+ transporter CorA
MQAGFNFKEMRNGFHPLIMEDILNTEQRPKTEVMDEYTYVVLKMIDSDLTAAHQNS